MSAAVALSSKLAGNDEFNGLDSTVDDLLDQPTTLRVAVVVYDVAKITETITKDGDDPRIPTVRIRKFEPLGAVGEVPDSITMAIAAAHERRTGRTALPLDVLDARAAHVEVVDGDEIDPDPED